MTRPAESKVLLGGLWLASHRPVGGMTARSFIPPQRIFMQALPRSSTCRVGGYGRTARCAQSRYVRSAC